MTHPIHPLAGTAEEVRAFEDASAPAAVAVPDSSNLGFAVEQRGDVWVVVEDAGGVCPASSHECALWNALIEARAALAAAPAAPVVLPEPAREALEEAASVLNSINNGEQHAVKVGDEVCYWQRQEWIDWAEKEVLPKVRAALLAGVSAPAAGDTAAIEQIADIFSIGSNARKNRNVVVENVRNAFRRARCLDLIEARYFTVQRPPVDRDDEDEGGEECLLNWGQEPEQYAAQFGEAIKRIVPQAPAADALDAADGWYLQDTRSYVGNDVLWWAKDGNGYTTDLSKAHVYTQEEAFRQAAMRGTDRAWPKAYIDGKTRPAVDMQYINHDAAIAAQTAKGDLYGQGDF